MRNPEYDRFGPWVLEITDNDPVPPLFIPHIEKGEEPLLSVKVPRNIERRIAKPGMNLYDYVISMYKDKLVILKRIEDEVQKDVFAYDQIVCIRNKHVLLKGTLVLINKSSVYEFNYNTVSDDIMKKLVSLIRLQYTDKTYPKKRTPIEHPEAGLSFYFNNFIALLHRENPDVSLIGYQLTENLGSIETRKLMKLFFTITRRQLLETLHFIDNRELNLFGRGATYKDILSPTFGREEIFVPLDRLKGYKCEQNDAESGIADLYLETEGGPIHFAFTQDNKSLSGYCEALEGITA